MITLTKEWLLKTIAELEEERDATPGAVNEDAANALAAMKLALASLEAEPVAHVDPSAFNNFSVYRAGDTDNKRMGREWMWANPDAGLIPVYTAPPAPSVDEDLLHMAASAIDDLLSNKDRSGAGVWADIPAKLRRAAMLQGAVQPQNQQQNIPENIPVNTPCKEAPEHIWLQTAGVWTENGEFSELTWCSDNQHEDDTLYVRADVVSGNSPVMNDYPETLPCPVSLEPGLKFGKGVATKILLEALQRRANYSDEIEVINEVCRDIKDGDFLAAAKINSSTELVNTAYKLPKPIKDHRLNSGPDADDYYAGYQAGWNDSIEEAEVVERPAYDIESFGIFSATEGESGLLLQIDQFSFGTEKCPQIGKDNMVPKFALQAIINGLQDHCDGMKSTPLIDILSTPAGAKQGPKE
ncbi:hypothetical protein [Enterobacter ludwigii]|uniref:hypothetical protein n=1 Tax=Enterobacter ludwigii TaxID=299767 RepID=UPI002FD00EC1